ncbi:hypothetical protein [Streptomyces sp. NBC_01614]|uniref:hypothetical protein n=1 Tax=Streptomyces sp. NBC_01614 TaxID=2975897 RepID=UPI00386C1A86
MTPADELRAAAKLLREDAHRAQIASPLPWLTTDEHVIRCGNEDIVADRSSNPSEAGDLPYIAAMHPGVGDKISGLLEAAAGFVDDYPDLTRPHIDDEPCSDHACHIVHASLAVARAINTGSQP